MDANLVIQARGHRRCFGDVVALDGIDLDVTQRQSMDWPAIYRLDFTASGRSVADGDGPKEANGYFQARTPTGDAPNPLWQFDGNVELLTANPKG